MTSDDGTSYSKLIDIKDFPDLGGTPETIETTTLSDSMKTSILGIQSLDNLEFTCNYSLTDFKKIKALEGKQIKFAVWFGGTEGADGVPVPDGSDGKFKFTGELSVYPVGASTNAVVEMKISIAPSTVIVLDA